MNNGKNISVLESEGRVPPQAVEVEEGILGALILDQSAGEAIFGRLQPEDFYKPANRHIFECVASLYEENSPIHLLSIENKLRDEGLLDICGGPTYISDLTRSSINPASADYYCQIIVEKSLRRKLIIDSSDSIKEAYDSSEDTYDVLDNAERRIFNLTTKGITKEVSELHDKLQDTLMEIDDLRKRPDNLIGIPSGLEMLDKMTSGWQNGDLVIVAARPSMGKDQPLTANIKTIDGWSTMGEMKPGIELASVDGKKNHVLRVYPQGKKPVYKVTFSDGRSTECGKEHLWRVNNRKWNRSKVLSTSELIDYLEKPSYKNRIWVDLVSGDFGKDTDIGIDYWLLGYLIGNGSLDKSSTRITTNDAESVAIERLGLRNHRSWEKFIPEKCLLASKYQRKQLLRGLIDSDGWVEQSGSMRYSTSSSLLAKHVQELVRSLGGLCSIKVKDSPLYTYKNEKKIGRTHYRCNIRFSNPEEFVSIFKKKKRAKNSVQPRLTISKIEYLRDDETQCIQVSHPNQTYITDKYIVTHNTALCLTCAKNAALYKEEDKRVPVAIFSLEMSTKQLTQRLVSMEAKINGQDVRKGKVNDADFMKLVEAAGRLSESDIFIDDTPALTLMELRSKCRRLVKEDGVGLVIVDYLQLMNGSGNDKAGNREQEIAYISRGLKALAKELDVPVIALSQLSRAVETRGGDKRPMLSDLRESGSIEQDADLVLFLYRAEYYGITTTNEGGSTAGLAEVIVAKQRNGPTGEAQVMFHKEFAKFENLYHPDPFIEGDSDDELPW